MSDVKLYLGDCLEIMPTLEDESVDAVITDPPYGADIAEWDKSAPIQFVLDECLRIAKGPVLWFGGRSTNEIFDFANYNPIPDRLLIWFVDFSLSYVTDSGIRQKYHPIWCWRLNDCNTFERDVISCATAKNNGINHPARKPEKLMRMLVANVKGLTVLDPFMGSGTTGVACVQTGRDFIGVEINPEYFEIAETRIKEAQLQLRMPF